MSGVGHAVIGAIKARFESGNSVPVTRAHITLAELSELEAAIRTQPAPDPLLDQMAEALQRAGMSAGFQYMTHETRDIIDAALSAYDARRKP